MRSFLLLCVVLAIAAATPAFAQSSAPTQAPATASQPLPDWDRLTPAQRELLIAPTRDRWNREPDRRRQFLNFAQRWQSMPPDDRANARRGMQRWETMTPQQREQSRAVFNAMRGMDRDARRAFMDNWRQMTPPQRADWAKAHPAPPPRGDHPDR